MYQSVSLIVDMLLPEAAGGFTTNPIKIDYNLKLLKTDKADLIERSKGISIPTYVFPAGAYVITLQFIGAFESPRMGFIHFSVSIDEYFNIFADNLSPKTVQAVFATQQKIKERGKQYQESVTLTDQFYVS